MATTINDAAKAEVFRAICESQDPVISEQPKGLIFWRYYVSVSPEDGIGGPFMDNGVDLEVTIRGIFEEHRWDLLFGFPKRVCRVRIEARFQQKLLLNLPYQRWRISLPPTQRIIDLSRTDIHEFPH